MRTRNLLCAVLAFAASVTAYASGNPQHGSEVFSQQCAACHSFKQGKNKIGPSLFAVVGRPAGTIPDYSYSIAIKSSGFSWSPEQLDNFLANPQMVIPGAKMPYPGLADPIARADLIAFLSSLQ